MQQRKLGNQGLVVSILGLGCFGMAEAYGKPDKQEAKATILRALELGVTMLDTADAYGPHTNEKLIGETLKEWKGQRPLIASKFGIVRENGQWTSVRGDNEYVRSSCEGSLKRLGVDTIDLYYQHRVDSSIPIEETIGAMAELVTEGKVRYLGLSEAAPQTIRRAHAVHPISALQNEYSLWERSLENIVLPTIRELGIGLVSFSPLGRGFLTGTVRSNGPLDSDDVRRTRFPRFYEENLQANLKLLDHVDTIAECHNATKAQIALAWLLAKGQDIIPIPGTKRRTYLEENLSSTNIDLTPQEITDLEQAFRAEAIAGGRYSPAVMETLDNLEISQNA